MMLTRIHACIHTYIHKYIHTYIHMCRYNERLESYVSDGEAATSNYTDGLTGVKLQVCVCVCVCVCVYACPTTQTG